MQRWCRAGCLGRICAGLGRELLDEQILSRDLFQDNSIFHRLLEEDFVQNPHICTVICLQLSLCGLPLWQRRFFEHDMGVGAADAKRTDPSTSDLLPQCWLRGPGEQGCVEV